MSRGLQRRLGRRRGMLASGSAGADPDPQTFFANSEAAYLFESQYMTLGSPTDIDSVDDITGNGHDLDGTLAANPPQYVAGGLAGRDCAELPSASDCYFLGLFDWDGGSDRVGFHFVMRDTATPAFGEIMVNTSNNRAIQSSSSFVRLVASGTINFGTADTGEVNVRSAVIGQADRYGYEGTTKTAAGSGGIDIAGEMRWGSPGSVQTHLIGALVVTQANGAEPCTDAECLAFAAYGQSVWGAA